VKNNLWHREIKNIKDCASKFYIRLSVMDQSGVLGEITTILGKHNVSLRSVMQKGREESKDKVTIVLITHKIEESEIDSAIKEIVDLKSVMQIDNIIRIEDFK